EQIEHERDRRAVPALGSFGFFERAAQQLRGGGEVARGPANRREIRQRRARHNRVGRFGGAPQKRLRLRRRRDGGQCGGVFQRLSGVRADCLVIQSKSIGEGAVRGGFIGGAGEEKSQVAGCLCAARVPLAVGLQPARECIFVQLAQRGRVGLRERQARRANGGQRAN